MHIWASTHLWAPLVALWLSLHTRQQTVGWMDKKCCFSKIFTISGAIIPQRSHVVTYHHLHGGHFKTFHATVKSYRTEMKFVLVPDLRVTTIISHLFSDSNKVKQNGNSVWLSGYCEIWELSDRLYIQDFRRYLILMYQIHYFKIWQEKANFYIFIWC